METKTLYALTLIIALMVGWFYYNSGRHADLAVSDQQLSYSAKDIRLLQTDDAGQLEAVTTAQSLRHYSKLDQTQLDQVHSLWYQQGQVKATLQADQAISEQGYQQIMLKGHVQVVQQSDQGPTTLYTDQLNGNLKTKQISSTSLVRLDAPQGQMSSQGFDADINQQFYQFYRVRMQYAKPS